MKYIWVILLSFASIFKVAGQQTNPMFYKEIILTHKPYTLQSITEEIQLQSGISFSYNADDINPDTKIKVKADRMTVAEMLALIQKQTGISYKIISQRHIIYTAAATGKKGKTSKPKPLKTAAKQHKQRHPKADASPKMETAVTMSRPLETVPTSTITDSATDATVVIVGDSAAVSVYYNGSGSGGGSGGNSGGGGGNATTKEDDPETADGIPRRKWRKGTSDNYRTKDNTTTRNVLNFFAANTMLGIGASFDEVYYFNPTLKFGMRFLYGIASYNMGSDKNSVRYGIGGAANIDDNWSMHFTITTGQSVSKAYSIPASDTTIPNTPLLATSRLTRYGISASYSFGNGFAIEGGLTFNALRTNYSSYGNPVTLSDILPAGYDADKKYPGIKPPYVMGSSYSANTTGNTKTWLGVQLTLLYHIRFGEE